MAEHRNRDRLLRVALFVLTVLAYARTWNFGLTYLDDNEIIRTRAEQLSSWTGLVDAFTHRYFLSENNQFYRPLVNLSFVFDAHVGGMAPSTYHFTNSLLHAGVVVLLFGLLRALRTDRPPAFAAACLFALHPMNVASVAWIPGRNDLLLGGFSLAALTLLAEPTPSRSARISHWLCFGAALGCKETALCLPLAFAALAVRAMSPTPRERTLSVERNWPARISGGIGLALGWLLIVFGYFWARSRVLTVPEGYAKQAIQSAITNHAALVSDLGKLLFPVRLQVIATAKDIDWRLGVGAIVVLAALAIGLRHELRPRVMLTAIVLIVAPLAMALLASGFILLENRLYLPLIGLSVFTAECLRVLLQRARWLSSLTCALVTSVFVVLGIVSVRYTALFRNREVFSEAAIKAAPSSYLAIWLRSQPTMRVPSGPRRATPKPVP